MLVRLCTHVRQNHILLYRIDIDTAVHLSLSQRITVLHEM